MGFLLDKRNKLLRINSLNLAFVTNTETCSLTAFTTWMYSSPWEPHHSPFEWCRLKLCSAQPVQLAIRGVPDQDYTVLNHKTFNAQMMVPPYRQAVSQMYSLSQTSPAHIPFSFFHEVS